MWAQLIAWMFKSRAAKVGGGVLGGTAGITLIMGLHANITGQIDKAEAQGKEYVQLKLDPFKVEVVNLKKEVAETKDMVKDIHRYLLNKNNK